MSNIWRWIIGILIGMAILGMLGFGGSNRQAYEGARGVEQSDWHNVNWKWTRLTDQAKGTTTTIPDPAKYTILFKTDGTLEGTADCNTFSGTYAQENGSFTIQIGAITRAFCGEQSLDQQYLTLLGSVAAGGPAGSGIFALETAGGAQRMEFQQ
jgi:heat shock protein HslJ